MTNQQTIQAPDHHPNPPIPVPAFLRSAPIKVWRSPAGLWFLRSEALQTGGVLRLVAEEQGSRWILYVPCDSDQWAGILCGLANDLQEAFTAAVQAMPTANSKPT